jgi:hypothetical protein
VGEKLAKVIFLHIPKTAGQSCYHFLDLCFDKERICPARENFQLVGRSVSSLTKYDLIYGHLDWSALDCVSDNAFVFTILREPRERIISFYFFLRRAAAQLTPEELEFAHNRGLRAALLDHPDVFFCGGEPDLRVFHDNLFDNIYTYYFAGRAFSSRSSIVDVLARPDNETTMDDIERCAAQNLSRLSGVYRISALDLLQDDLRRFGVEPREPILLANTRVNEGVGGFDSRLVELKDLGATPATFDRIESMAEFDVKLWRQEALFRT